ncbi:oligosaccharide flippase family protein [SAR116 cluster bacterium]|nr:oligosaccharide flippase family protein [SAR116 cluster bacterium]
MKALDKKRSFLIFRKKNFGKTSKDIIFLYGAYAVSFVVPLLQLSITSRALGVEAFGVLLMSLALGTILGMVIDYGFYISAQRSAINLKQNRVKLAKLLTDVIAAKLFLTVFILTIFGSVAWLVKFHQYDFKLLLSVLIFAAGLGSSLTWFFRGSGRPVAGSIYEIITKLLAFVLVFWIVRNSEDVWKYFGVISGCQFFVFIIALIDLRRMYEMPAPNLKRSLILLKNSAMIFMVHVAGHTFSSANSLLLGLIAMPTVVSVFGSAERVGRAAAVVLDPIRIAFFPKAHEWLEEGFSKAFRRVALMSFAMVLFASMLSLLIFVFSEQIVLVVFGVEFIEVVGILKIISVLPVILTINHSISYLWILPRKLERQSLLVLLFAIILNLSLAFWLVPTYGAKGMANIIVFSEGMVAALVLIICVVDARRLSADTSVVN